MQWNTWKVGNYGWTSRGPLKSMVVHAAVQWFALFSVRVATESDRKIDLSQRVS
mgnify:CR=1 FL=1